MTQPPAGSREGVESSGDLVIRTIRQAFETTERPGDPFLQGSFDGEEPYDEVGHFKGKTDWSLLEPAFLDARYCALSFFSEGGFRFYLPAYLIADVQGLLLTADPAFHLTHGFSDRSYEEQRNDRTITHRSGGSKLLNPRRYGAMTWCDHARARLSVFTREEAQAIVAYLRWKGEPERVFPPDEARVIEAALTGFWLDRAERAPTAADLRRQIAEDLAEYRALTGE